MGCRKVAQIFCVARESDQKVLGRTMVWSELFGVTLRTHDFWGHTTVWSEGSGLQVGLIGGQSLKNGLENGRTKVWSEANVALESAHKSYKRLDNVRPTVCSEGKVVLKPGQWSHYGLIRDQCLDK